MDKETLQRLAIDKYKILFDLWKSENPLKTNMLQMLPATNSILVTAFFLSELSIWIPLVGFLFATVWTLSIGRIASYQRRWRSQPEEVRMAFPDNPLFQTHRNDFKHPWWGGISSRYYLLGTPLAIAAGWLAVFIYLLARAEGG